ncbi:hypothetical protein L195_g063230 [Trifolium pratense]|uniref:Uncharacterized protein n=1 Tax=Trifolium pratense TaxID=57577 RepID=A0A2K3KKI3_TRIPR|nr:hypothetical protein L195_g063230 [Trifolium pratense]
MFFPNLGNYTDSFINLVMKRWFLHNDNFSTADGGSDFIMNMKAATAASLLPPGAWPTATITNTYG